MTIAAFVLAAGGSTRLGRPKQLLEYQGTTLVRRATMAALGSGADAVFVVVGSDALDVRAAVADLLVTFVQNDAWATGMGSSISCATHAATRFDAALLLTCDQPAVTAEHLASMVDSYKANRSPIVASTYEGTSGVPALFDAQIYPDLLALDAKSGAKSVIARDPSRVVNLCLAGGEIDVDTEADYHSLIRR